MKPNRKKPALTSQQLKSMLRRGGELLKTLISSHPAVVGFAIMTGAVIVQTFTYEGDHSRRKEAFNQAGNLYNGVQGSIVALAAAPVIAQGLGLAASAISARKTETEVETPP